MSLFSRVFHRKSKDRTEERRSVSWGDTALAKKHCDNEVVSSKYNIFTFLPLNLWEQFHRPINLYFVTVVVLQFVPSVAPVSPYTTLFPISVAFLTNTVKEGIDDLRRHLQDRKNNARPYRVVNPQTLEVQDTRCRDIHVGDLLLLRPFESVPSDVVVLLTSDEDGEAFISTQSLDGETGTKRRVALLRKQYKGIVGSDDAARGAKRNTPAATAPGEATSLAEQQALEEALRFLAGVQLTIDSEGPNPFIPTYHGTSQLTLPAANEPSLSVRMTAAAAAAAAGMTPVSSNANLSLGGAGGSVGGGRLPPHHRHARTESAISVGSVSTPAVRRRTAASGFATAENSTSPLVGVADGGGSTYRAFRGLSLPLLTSTTPATAMAPLEAFSGPRLTLPVSSENVILSSSQTQNTLYTLALVVFTGMETKVNMTRMTPPTKCSGIDYSFNIMCIAIFCLQFVLVAVYSVLSALHLSRQHFWYLGSGEGLKIETTEYFPVLPLRYFTMLSPMVPLSFKVMVEISKGYVSSVISWDDDLKDEHGQHATVNNSAIAEDLGQVEYVFSDKTGTLTNNCMSFHTIATANGEVYVDHPGDPDAMRAVHLRARTSPDVRNLLMAMTFCNTIERSLGTAVATAGDVATCSTAPPSPAVAAASLHSGLSSATNLPAFLSHSRTQSTASVQPSLPPLGRWMSCSPDEVALVHGAARCGMMLTERSRDTATAIMAGEGVVVRVSILKIIHFTSERGRMSVLLRRHTVSEGGANVSFGGRARDNPAEGSIILLAKGSDEKVLPLCRATEAGGDDDRTGAASVRPATTTLASAAMGKTAWSRNDTGGATTPTSTTTQGSSYHHRSRNHNPSSSVHNRTGSIGSSAGGGGSIARTLSTSSAPLMSAMHGGSKEGAQAEGSVLSRLALRNGAAEPPSLVSPPSAFLHFGSAQQQQQSGGGAGGFKSAETLLTDFSCQGLRTLVYAYREVSESEAAEWLAAFQQQAQQQSPGQDSIESEVTKEEQQKRKSELIARMERDLIYCGCTAVQDDLQEDANATIAQLRQAGMRVWMLTGDRTETARQTAVASGLLTSEDRVVSLSPNQNHTLLSAEEQLHYVTGRIGRLLDTHKVQLEEGRRWVWWRAMYERLGLQDFVSEFRGRDTMRYLQSVIQPLRYTEEQYTYRDTAAGTFGEDGGVSAEAAAEWVSRHDRNSGSQEGGSDTKRGGTEDAATGATGAASLRNLRSTALPAAFVQSAAVEHETNTATSPATSHHQSVSNNGDYSVTLSGKTVDLIFHSGSEELLKNFRTALLYANTVVCSRTAPDQKALLVQMMKDAGKTTLAVGDGGNDVAMIQTAHVGVGIKGNEGNQAARAADFSISQFRFLSKLLLVHGHTAFHRTAMIVQQSFWKTVLIAWVQLLFNNSTDFSGVSYWDSFSLMLYNAIPTVPVTFLCVMDIPLSPSLMLQHPQLYRMSQRARYLCAVTFYGYIARAFLHGTIVYFCAMALQSGPAGVILKGHTMDRSSDFYAAYFAVVTIHTYTVLTESHSIMFPHWQCFYFSVWSCFLCFGLAAKAPGANEAFSHLLVNPHFYLSYIALTALVCLSLAAYATIKYFWFPDLLQFHRLMVKTARTRWDMYAPLRALFYDDNLSHFWHSQSPLHTIIPSRRTQYQAVGVVEDGMGGNDDDGIF